MKTLALLLLASGTTIAAPLNIDLLESRVSMELATHPTSSPSELLRLYLLKALLKADRREFEAARRWIRLARSLWKDALAANPKFLGEIEMTEADIRRRELVSP